MTRNTGREHFREQSSYFSSAVSTVTTEAKKEGNQRSQKIHVMFLTFVIGQVRLRFLNVYFSLFYLEDFGTHLKLVLVSLKLYFFMTK